MINRANIWDRDLRRNGLTTGLGGDAIFFILNSSSQIDSPVAEIRYEVPPVPTEPTEPSCTVTQPPMIDFKTISANDIPSGRFGSRMVVSCRSDTTFTVKFVFANGTDNETLRNGLNVKLLVGGWDGAGGFTSSIKKDVPEDFTVNATLTAVGNVSEGFFRTVGVVKMNYD